MQLVGVFEAFFFAHGDVSGTWLTGGGALKSPHTEHLLTAFLVMMFSTNTEQRLPKSNVCLYQQALFAVPPVRPLVLSAADDDLTRSLSCLLGFGNTIGTYTTGTNHDVLFVRGTRALVCLV